MNVIKRRQISRPRVLDRKPRGAKEDRKGGKVRGQDAREIVGKKLEEENIRERGMTIRDSNSQGGNGGMGTARAYRGWRSTVAHRSGIGSAFYPPWVLAATTACCKTRQSSGSPESQTYPQPHTNNNDVHTIGA
jgi:hypothetical protein